MGVCLLWVTALGMFVSGGELEVEQADGSLAGGAARVHVTEIGRPWVAEMTWSAWTVVNETTCEFKCGAL